MALLAAGGRLHTHTCRAWGGNAVAGIYGLGVTANPHTFVRGSGVLLNRKFSKASVPEGHLHPAAWKLPQKPGAMSSRYNSLLVVSAAAQGWMGMPGTGSASFAVSVADMDGQLIVSGTGASTITITVGNLLLTASLNGSGTASFSVTTNTPLLGALAGGAGTATVTFTASAGILPADDTPPARTATASFSFSAALVPFATGELAGLAKLAGDGVVLEVQYNGAVYVSDFGADGVEYPAGTATYPCRTIAGADYIADKYSLREYWISGNYTLAKAYSNVSFNGWGPLQFAQINLNNQALDTVHFRGCVVTGKLNAAVISGGGWQDTMAKVDFVSCYLFEIEDLEGTAKDCQIEGATLIKPGGWLSATGIVIEGDFTVFDLRSTTGTTVSMDVSSGWAQFINGVTGCLIELNVKGGEVSLEASCTGGEYYLEGVGTLFNDSAMVEKENHFIWDEKIDGDLGAAKVQRIMASALAGKVSGAASNAPVFRDLADTKDRITATTDASGNRTAITLDPD